MPFNLSKKKGKDKDKEPEKENQKVDLIHICPFCCTFVRGDTDDHVCFPNVKRAPKADSPVFKKADELQGAAKTAALEFWSPLRQQDSHAQVDESRQAEPTPPAQHAQVNGIGQATPRQQVQRATVEDEAVASTASDSQDNVTAEHSWADKPLPPNPQITQPAQSPHPEQPPPQAQPSEPLQYTQIAQPVQAAQAIPQVSSTGSAQPAPHAQPAAVPQPATTAQPPSETPVSLVGTFQTRPTSIKVKQGANSSVFLWNSESNKQPAIVETGNATRLVFPVSDNSQVSASGARGSAHASSQIAPQPASQPVYCPPQAAHPSAGLPAHLVRSPVDYGPVPDHLAATGLHPSAAHLGNPSVVCAPHQQHTSAHTAHTFVPAFPSAQAQAQHFPAEQRQSTRGVPGSSAQAEVAACQQHFPTAPAAFSLSGGPGSQPSQATPFSRGGAFPNNSTQAFTNNPFIVRTDPSAATATSHIAQASSPQVGPQDHHHWPEQQWDHHHHHQQQTSVPIVPGPNVAPDQPPPTQVPCTSCVHPPTAPEDQDNMFFPYHYMSHPAAFGRPEPYYAGGLGIPYMMGMGGQGYGLGAAMFGGGWPGMSGYPYAVKPSNPYGYSNIYGLNF